VLIRKKQSGIGFIFISPGLQFTKMYLHYVKKQYNRNEYSKIKNFVVFYNEI